MKPKRFDPVVSRVKLNPEQAVLACACHTHEAERYLDWGDGSRHGRPGATHYKVCGAVSPKGVSSEPQCVNHTSSFGVATSKGGGATS